MSNITEAKAGLFTTTTNQSLNLPPYFSRRAFLWSSSAFIASLFLPRQLLSSGILFTHDEGGEIDFISEMPQWVQVPGIFDMAVEPQPTNNDNYVTMRQGVVSLYLRSWNDYQTVGLLAHNLLAGRQFFDLKLGQRVRLSYSFDRSAVLVINNIQLYQGMGKNGAFTDLREVDRHLNPTGPIISAGELYTQIYNDPHSYGEYYPYTVFQTCINHDNNLKWGLLFVSATGIPISRQIKHYTKKVR